jgi:hypothetical protein
MFKLTRNARLVEWGAATLCLVGVDVLWVCGNLPPYRHPIPPARNRTASSRRNTRLGRPSCLPSTRAVLTLALSWACSGRQDPLYATFRHAYRRRDLAQALAGVV